MNTEQRQLIKNYLDIFLRRKNIILICLLLGLIAGLFYYATQPKLYKCTSLLKYQRQSINPTAMSPDDIRTQTRDAVETVTQQIMSRSSLEEIIKKFDLYEQSRRNLPMEDIVEMMRERHIKTDLQRNGDVFEVSYIGDDQEKVLKVTNALAARFIEENLRYRQEMASQTSSYIKDELKMAKDALDKKELAMRDYKLRYYNEMPEQLTNNMNRLNSLQEQYQNNQESVQELERTRLLVQEQIALRKESLAQLTPEPVSRNASPSSKNSELSDITQLRLKLKNLQTKYTDKHPEIRRLKKTLQNLESKQGKGTSADSEESFFDPQIMELKQQLKDVELNIAQLKEEREELLGQIQKYEGWIAAAPIREAEWSALTRDYEQFDQHYQHLVTQSLQAESAQTLENQQKGSQFKIVDAAHFPEEPFKPDFLKIMLMTFMLSLGAGAGLAMGLEILGTSFKDPNEVEKYLDIPVICAVPVLYTEKEIRHKKILGTALYSLIFIAYASVLLVAFYFWKQGIIIL